MSEPEPNLTELTSTPERIIAQETRSQKVYVDKKTGKLWTEDEVAKWVEENDHLRKLGLL